MSRARKGAVGLVEQIRQAVRDSGRTLSDLGERCGIGKDRLSRFARGERGLGLSALERLCEALGLRLVQEADDAKARGRG